MALRLQVMQHASIRLPEAEDDAWHRSQIIDFTPGKEILLAVPRTEDEEIEVPMRTEIEVKVFLPDGLRQFSAVVRGRDSLHGGVLRIEWPDESVRIQRREYVRVQMALPVDVTFRLEDMDKDETVKALTTDLSAGGVRLNLPRNIPAGTTVDLHIVPTDHPPYQIRGRIVHAGQHENGPDKYPHWAAVEFLNVSTALRNDLTQFVFAVQREQMRRSLG